MNKKLNLLFKMENVIFSELIQELEKHEKLNDIIDYGKEDEKTALSFFNKEEQTQLYSYVVNYKNESFLFYEKLKVENGKEKEYISIEIFKIN